MTIELCLPATQDVLERVLILTTHPGIPAMQMKKAETDSLTHYRSQTLCGKMLVQEMPNQVTLVERLSPCI